MAIETIPFKDEIIYFNDWRNLKNLDDFAIKIDEGNQNTLELIKQGKKDILTLTDVSNSFVYGKTLQLLKEASQLSLGITKKSATVGLSTAKKIILNGINTFANSNIKAFDSLEEAKEWLVKE